MRMSNLTAGLVVVLFYGAIAFVLVTGWVRWARQSQPRNAFSYIALIGFSLANVSLIIAAAGIIYARKIGGFPYYDPRLMRLFRWGGTFSLGGLIFFRGGRMAAQCVALVCGRALYLDSFFLVRICGGRIAAAQPLRGACDNIVGRVQLPALSLKLPTVTCSHSTRHCSPATKTSAPSPSPSAATPSRTDTPADT
jgi:hypothetical protein